MGAIAVGTGPYLSLPVLTCLLSELVSTCPFMPQPVPTNISITVPVKSDLASATFPLLPG